MAYLLGGKVETAPVREYGKPKWMWIKVQCFLKKSPQKPSVG